jgi:hypothetical protein
MQILHGGRTGIAGQAGTEMPEVRDVVVCIASAVDDEMKRQRERDAAGGPKALQKLPYVIPVVYLY